MNHDDPAEAEDKRAAIWIGQQIAGKPYAMAIGHAEREEWLHMQGAKPVTLKENR